MKQKELIVINHMMKDIGSIKIKEHLPNDLTLQDVMELIIENATAWKELKAYYECAMMEVETKFKVLDKEFSLQYDRNPIETIKTRLKTLDSLAEKLIRKGIRPTLESVEDNIYDMAGVRVICAFPEDVYLLAKSFLQQDDIRLVLTKDYIANPKENGYRALHLVVEIPIFLHDEKKMMKVEIQLRTIGMDFWASLEHKLSYKKSLPRELEQELSTQLLECANRVSELDMQMQRIRDRIEQKS